MTYEIIEGDCLDVMRGMADGSVDAVVTDPPAGIAFMGKAWDADRGGRREWVAWLTEAMAECLRVLKPGGHALVWALPRTSHWTATAIEDAGFEIRDVVMHIHGQGFPKNLNITKAAAGYACQCGNKGIAYKHGEDAETRPDMRDVPTAVPPKEQDFTKQSPVLFRPVLREVACLQPEDMCSHERNSPNGPGGMDSGEPRILRDEYGRGKESRLARGSDIQKGQGELSGAEVCQMPPGIHADGAQGRVCNGTPPCDGANGASVPVEGGGCPSSESQHADKYPGELGTVAVQCDTQSGGVWPLCSGCGKPIIPDGLGTALKPAAEHWILARKPISEKTVAANVLKHGTGAINVDGCRIGNETITTVNTPGDKFKKKYSGSHIPISGYTDHVGRWPANVTFDEEAAEVLDAQSGNTKSGTAVKRNLDGHTYNMHQKWGLRAALAPDIGYGDSGGASRFFYVAKPSRSERGEENIHPTVKPIALMSYLCRLITPPNGTVLDPFAGSGTTGLACMQEGFAFVGIERESEYAAIARRRLTDAAAQPRLELTA